jgi:hypothetical protein
VIPGVGSRGSDQEESGGRGIEGIVDGEDKKILTDWIARCGCGAIELRPMPIEGN